MLKSAVLLLTCFVAFVMSENPIVQTKNGKVQGFTKDVDNIKLSLFQGIPYAKPPVLSRRFKAPEAVDNWPGVIQATTPRAACPQNTMMVKKMLGPNFSIQSTDEDCLHLNVYVPGTPAEAKKNQLAVMVFIHGGGFQMASGTLWDVSGLAAHGNVVAVTMNFRIGVLGFLSTNDSAARGNWGLLDQLLALKWIKNNIREFGGDKNRITLFGHSSGAYSVGLHIVSPMSQGLVTRGISLGGTIVSPSFLTTDPMMRVKPLAMMTKCITKDQMKSGDFDNNKLVECLRKVSTSELIRHDMMTPGAFTPVIDGSFITDIPLSMLMKGDYSPVNYIVGGNSDEGTAIANKIQNFYKESLTLNMTDYENHMEGVANYALIKPVSKAAITALKKVTSAKYYPEGHISGLFKKAYLHALGDLMISKIFMNGHMYSLHGTIYIYRFTHKPSNSMFPDWVGPGHVEEMPFIFGYTLKNGTEEEKNLSMNWMKTWGRFARTGVPSFNDGTVNWTPLTFPDMNYMEITVNMSQKMEKKMWKTDIRRFWNKAIPEVNKLGQMVDNGKAPTVKCEKFGWDISVDAAEQLFIFVCVIMSFLLVICGGLLYMLYRSNIKQTRLAQQARNSGCSNAVFDEDAADQPKSVMSYTKM